MKTLAVIKNELFQDYLRFVSTSDLPSVLDNPDIPVPFTSVESVDNSNSDALMEQLKTYFNSSKVNNKDFYKLDEDTFNQLQFMFNLIKLSSGQTGTVVQASAPVKEAAPVEVNTVSPAVVIPETSKEEEKVQEKVDTVNTIVNTPAVNTPEPVAMVQPAAPVVVAQPLVQETAKEPVMETEVEDVFSTEEDDPFGFKSSNEPVKTATVNNVAQDTVTPAPIAQPAAPIVVAQPVAEQVSEPVAVIDTPLEAPVVETAVEASVPEVVTETVAEVTPEVAPPTVELIASLGIPKGATIHFIKDQTITANLVDEKTVSFDGQNMTLVEAAKAAFKKSDTVGMAVGLSNWTFEGETLKAWKEKQLN